MERRVLSDHLEQFVKSFALTSYKPLAEQDEYLLDLRDDTKLYIKELEDGYALRSNIIETPKENLENLYSYLMNANLLGQGTGGAEIAIADETLILQSCIDADIDAKQFEDAIESFWNYLDYWKEEVHSFQKQTQQRLF